MSYKCRTRAVQICRINLSNILIQIFVGHLYDIGSNNFFVENLSNIFCTTFLRHFYGNCTTFVRHVLRHLYEILSYKFVEQNFDSDLDFDLELGLFLGLGLIMLLF